MNEEIIENSVDEEIDAILPDGWSEDRDLFADDTETQEATEPVVEAEPTEKPAEAPTPTTEQGEEVETQAAEETEESEAPTTEQEDPATPANRKIRIPYTYNHTPGEAEVDEADLPGIYQRSLALEQVQRRADSMTPLMLRMEQLAKREGYDSITEMLDKNDEYKRDEIVEEMTSKGVPKEMAEDYADRKLGRGMYAQPTMAYEQSYTQDAVQSPTRDYNAELWECVTAHPELAGQDIPAEVTQAVANGETYLAAYEKWDKGQKAKAANDAVKAENEQLKAQLKQYRQNADAEKRAPVRRSSGAPTSQTGESAFERGFDSIWK